MAVRRLLLTREGDLPEGLGKSQTAKISGLRQPARCCDGVDIPRGAYIPAKTVGTYAPPALVLQIAPAMALVVPPPTRRSGTELRTALQSNGAGDRASFSSGLPKAHDLWEPEKAVTSDK
jgi:hypothetical protein